MTSTPTGTASQRCQGALSITIRTRLFSEAATVAAKSVRTTLKAAVFKAGSRYQIVWPVCGLTKP